MLARTGTMGCMEPEITYSDSLEGVDWAALKAALAADHFDNGRTPEEYEAASRRSHAVLFARDGERIVGNARVLSDGVCNAYLVDVWTASAYRRRGIASEMVRMLLATVPGQHVALFTEDMRPFYEGLGFEVEHEGMSTVVGTWLNRPPQGT
jgi:ribosomal protein S18 acetylase RimI-like enzyme